MKLSLNLLPLLFGIVIGVPATAAPSWRPAQAERLAEWLDGAANEALPAMTDRAVVVRAAAAGGDPARLDQVATAAALDLARMMREGSTTSIERHAWNIPDDAPSGDPENQLAAALAGDALDLHFAALRPNHPWYARLQRAFVNETDPARRDALALNLERWRWMPRDLGPRYLLVNTATYELSLWENGRVVRRWPVVVGKISTPTPTFTTQVSGIIFNPWWEIPQSIVAESVGKLVRESPAEARRRGYVVENGRYRQKPGPSNALGQMKLVMPNNYSVYLHDTPSRTLFEREIRAFSHGCVRVGDALDLATTLLAATPGWSRTRISAVVDSRETIHAKMVVPIPVYIAYFTAEPDEDGHVVIHPDIYGRDGKIN